ncbi:MAG: carboxypeptidase regulatory-like domain-containing protein, partial [Candidatus Eisenbacteria bacterium]|nr:carboxypeptidase regulatory-like domain-containing protein [Candidatus Eisenbacteria bacterium]
VQFTTSSDTATGLFRYDLYTDSKGEGLIHLPKGEYKITGEAPWPYEIVSIEPTTLEITDAEIFHGVAIELRERDDLPLGDAVITVLLDDEPFAGVAVLLFGDNLADSTHTGVTNEDGVVRFRVPEGPYFVFVESPDGQFFPEDEPLIHVIAGETVEITLNFSSRGTGGGETNVTVSTVAGNEGVPCVEVRFFPVGSPTEDTPLHDLPNGDIWNGYVLITDGEGMGFIDLPPGEYEVEGMDRPGYRVISVDPASFEIAEGDSIDVLVEMEKLDDGVGIINVIDSEKNPIPGVLVTLFPEAGDLAFEGETNKEGVLTLELPAATYYVEIPPPPGFYYPTDEVVTITIEPNATSEITLVFEPIDANAPGYLTVFSLVETFDEAIEVDIEISQGDVIVTSAALTMENGWNYTGEFSPGEYRVTARAPKGYSVLNDDVLRDDLADEAFIDVQVSPQGNSAVFFVVFPQAETDSD